MSSDVKVSVRGLTKAFPLHPRGKVKGLSTDGAAALGYLLRQTLRDKPLREPGPKSKDFLYALDQVDFDVRAGEVLGIIGRNGAGKSTLLKILARVLDPSAGRVTIRGRVVSLLELGIGFAPEMTVLENIQIHGRLAGIPAGKIDAAEHSILEFSGLGDFRDVPLAACPSGSAVQLAFAAMVSLDADIILADEILAVGDSRFRQTCEDRVRAVSQSGEAVLFVSHDMAAIRRICTRTIWIERGKIVMNGPVDEVVRAYTTELLAGRLLRVSDEGAAAGSRILDLRLLDAQRAQVGALQITEDGYIDCLFRIERAPIAVMVQMELWHGRSYLIGSTSRQITSDKQATFRAGIRIPGNLLNETSYQAKCRLLVSPIGDDNASPIAAAEETLNFSVMNPHPAESVWANWAWGRDGIISPKLSWTVDRQDSDPTS